MNFKEMIIFLVVFNIVGDGIFYLLSVNTRLSFPHILLQGLLSSVLALILILLIQKAFARRR